MTGEPLTYTPAEFAKLFGKSQSWAYRQLYAGKIEGITEYGRVMIPAIEAEKILKKAGRYLGAQVKAGSIARTKRILKERKERNRFKGWVERRRGKSHPSSRRRASAKNWSRTRKKEA